VLGNVILATRHQVFTSNFQCSWSSCGTAIFDTSNYSWLKGSLQSDLYCVTTLGAVLSLLFVAGAMLDCIHVQLIAARRNVVTQTTSVPRRS